MVMGSLTQEAPLVIVGAGPGGYVAALRAADLGIDVTLVEERDSLGGVCLQEGCIPSKTLIHAAELVHEAKRGESFGVKFGPPQIDVEALRSHAGKVVGSLTEGVKGLLQRRGVEILRGRARFEDGKTLVVENSGLTTVKFEHAIIATGSVPIELPGQRDIGAWCSSEALALPSVPKRLLVVGGGYIGLELGMVYAALGSRITMVLNDATLLSGADKDLAAVVGESCRKQFDDIRFGTKVAGMERAGDGTFAVTIEQEGRKETLQSDAVLVAIGRKPNTRDLGLEKTAVRQDAQGRIAVDPQRRTADPRIFAIGDVTPGPMLAHKASREGKVAAEVIAGLPSAFDNRAMPAVVFTDPELAWAGPTEEEAQKRGLIYKVGKFPLRALGRSRTLGRTDGLVKVLFEPETERLLGVGIVGPHASELVAECVLAIEMGARLEDLMVAIHPHPTMSEAIMEAAEVAAGHPTHIAKPKG